MTKEELKALVATKIEGQDGEFRFAFCLGEETSGEVDVLTSIAAYESETTWILRFIEF